MIKTYCQQLLESHTECKQETNYSMPTQTETCVQVDTPNFNYKNEKARYYN